MMVDVVPSFAQNRWTYWACQLAGAAGSAMLLAAFSAGDSGWILGFVALLPWLLVLERARSWTAVLISALLMTVAFVALVFHWFGAAFGAYIGLDRWVASLILLALAPLLQPQLIVFALVRYGIGKRHSVFWRTLAGAAAWLACEWLWPKLLGDTLGHGLQPSTVLRQLADLGGAAGLTLLLILVNELLVRAVGRWRHCRSQSVGALAFALLLIALAAGYGSWRQSALAESLGEPAASVRVGLIQANITGIEQRRREQGTYAVMRQILDTHFMMSEHAVRAQGADVVLWSETIYPTTFASPKSDDGAVLDRELMDFVGELGVPLVFGTYDRDDAGEYNAAAFIEPERGLLGRYRKTHPFPFTETVPRWLEGPLLRRWLPWTGAWLPGDGARVFPLRTIDGREVNVVPLICLDDVRPQLAIDGARLGAQAILGLSNDAWFTDYPAGARLHLAVASFRSVETRLPQLRATTNGLSALIDESGAIVASTGIGQQAVLVGEIPIREPVPTLMTRWGDWLGRAALWFLIGFGLVNGWPKRRQPMPHDGVPMAPVWSSQVVLLSPAWRALAGALRLLAAAGLTWLMLRMFWRDGFQVNSIDQILLFVFTVALPLVLAGSIQRLFRMKASIVAADLVLVKPGLRIEIPLRDIQRLRVWALALPGTGVDMIFADGKRWSQGLVLPDPAALQVALQAAQAPAQWADARSAIQAEIASSRACGHHRYLDHALVKFLLFPLLLALPAFRLHQHITFGGTFGEYQTYGLVAWLSGLLIWWAAWAIGLMMFAAVLRVLIEAVVLSGRQWRHGFAANARLPLERLGRLVYFLGVPIWLTLRLI